MKKNYTNFEDVDRQLEILKLEREIQWRKLGLKVENTTNLVAPNNLMKVGLSTLTTSLKETSGVKSVLIGLLIKLIVNKFSKK